MIRCQFPLLNLLIVGSGFIAIFTSCKKDKNEVETSVISYTLEGTPQSESSKTAITFTFGGAIQTTGEEQPTDHLYLKSTKLNLTVHDHGSVIQTGTYTGKTYLPSGYTKEVIFNLTDQNGVGYTSSYTDPNTTITFTQVNRKGVKGTFSGDVISQTNDTLHITNGSFQIYTYKI